MTLPMVYNNYGHCTLADWQLVPGGILFIEATQMAGKGSLQLTGN